MNPPVKLFSNPEYASEICDWNPPRSSGGLNSGSQVVKRGDDKWFGIIAEPISIPTGSSQSSTRTERADPPPFFNQNN